MAADSPSAGAAAPRPAGGAPGFEAPAYSGPMLVLVTFVLALANLMEVLDLTIANVAIPTITGDLAVAPTQGAWVITSYAVANAVTVPLTGWFAQRFGQVRMYSLAIASFTLASLLCALATSLELLVAARVLQGAAAGFMVPLSQALLMASFPPKRRAMGMAIWGMTITVAPILGPILGGWIVESYHWSWIFLINIPVGIFASLLTWQLMKDRETPTRKLPVDGVGMALLIVAVGALQLMLDKGRELDWFGSELIVGLAVASAFCFAMFLAWESTEEHPIVDLGLLKFHNFRYGVIALGLGFGLFFASVILLPLWLQTQMNYNSRWAGYALAPAGVLAVVFFPIVGRNLGRLDPRALCTVGFLIFAAVGFWRAGFTTGADYKAIALPQLLQGAGIAFFFAPLMSIIMAGIPASKLATASGLSNFLRMTAASVSASLVLSIWDDRQSVHRSQLVEHLNPYDPQTAEFVRSIGNAGFAPDQVNAQLDRLLGSQAFMLATNDIFWAVGVAFVLLIPFIWVTRPPFGAGPGGH